MLLVNMSLNFQTVISQIPQYFFLKKCAKLSLVEKMCEVFALQKLLSHFQQKILIAFVLQKASLIFSTKNVSVFCL